jgi:sarcosine oxidase subunit alpha
VSSGETSLRIERHPVLDPLPDRWVSFTFNGRNLRGRKGEAVSSAIFAAGIHVFGHHHKDQSPQGIFCANGQCSQCTLVIDGVPMKSCIIPLEEGMVITSLEGLPELSDTKIAGSVERPQILETDVLILGAGPSGMAAAIELGRSGIQTVIVDDKNRLGGKLVLQTHKFFGSQEDCYAGTRGTEIAILLARQISELRDVEVWLESVVLGVFCDGTIGVRHPSGYRIVKPRHLLVATGAREKSLPFPGCTLPGVYGAGAFQTEVNRDLIRCSRRVFVVGGGNVGLIGAYHALQAEMTVVGLAEAMPVCGGYKVHADKILRLGVPIYTGHSVLAAHGGERLEAVTITGVDGDFLPVQGTEKTFAIDTLLIAVGLDPVNEFYLKAREFGLNSWIAGDAEEIAEASSAMFTGKIRGMEIARALEASGITIPSDLAGKAEVLRSQGGRIGPYTVPGEREGIFPVLHCIEEIPCNPCMTSCPKDLIGTTDHPILGNPVFHGECIGCERCVAVCPGLAVTLVDFRKSSGLPVVTLPFELGAWRVSEGDILSGTDMEGRILGDVRVIGQGRAAGFPRTGLLKVEAPAAFASSLAGVSIQKREDLLSVPSKWEIPLPDSAIVCRCERVTAAEVREQFRNGVTDLNELKVLTRAGFGACGGKTCKSLISRICWEEGLGAEGITEFTERPLFAETELGYFAGGEVSDD